jgi:predicted component of type VI protein secretion system
MYNTNQYNTTLYNLESQVSIAFHYLHGGSYRTLAYAKNRVFVVGAADTATGEAEVSAQLALVGERLDFKYQPLASTSALAAQIAAAALAKARLEAADGFVTAPPNCGIELYDVIRIVDPLCAQVARNYRVMGIRLVYDPTTQQYYQQLTLGEV